MRSHAVPFRIALVLGMLSLPTAHLPVLAAEMMAGNPQAIAEVAAGRTDTARASWWGFDERDATASLQAAINSRATRVIIDKLATPWIVKTIHLASDKEIICEEGVVVEAKRGEFLGKGDCLLLANGCRNLTIRGNGATFRMHKSDYHKPPYELAEWRHTLSLRGCENVVIENLTLADSGGDGIYFGTGSQRATNRNIVIRKVVCDGHNRQGISVITADNLLIEECRLQNTRGTAPEAGIDFEPNHPEEVLSNCVLRNVRSDNNAGHAYHFYLGNLAERSQPISIRLENCSSSGCDRHSASIAIDNRNGERSVRGSIEFVNCRFDNDRGGGIQIRGNEGDGCRMRFVECTVIRQDVNDLSTAPITILAPRRPDLTTGNIELARCVVRDALDRRPISLSASPLIGLENLSGSLDVVSPAGERSYTLDAAQLQQWFPDQGRIARVPRWDFDWRTCQSVTAGGVSFVDGRGSVRLRQRASLIVWAEAHQPLKLEVIMEPVGRYTAGPGQLQLTAPTGEPQRLPPQVAAGRVAYEFTPRQDGPHRLDWTGSSHETLRPVRCSRPLAILSELSGTSLIHPVGTLQFRVPAAVTRWAIVVGGAGPGERVTATIRDAAGNTVASQENIAATHLFMLQRQPSTDDQIWSITFARPSEGVLEDVSLYCVGIPPLLSISAGQ